MIDMKCAIIMRFVLQVNGCSKALLSSGSNVLKCLFFLHVWLISWLVGWKHVEPQPRLLIRIFLLRAGRTYASILSHQTCDCPSVYACGRLPYIVLTHHSS